jgi:hypothetical protein
MEHMRLTGIVTKLRAGHVVLCTVLAVALGLLSAWSTPASAAPNAARNATAIQAVSSNQTTHQTPGIASLGTASSSLYLGWAGDNPGHHIFVTTAASLNSSVQLTYTVLAGTGVGMCAFLSRPYIVWAGTNDQMYIGWYNRTATLQNYEAIPGAITYHTPSCAADTSGSTIEVAWTGTNSHLNLKGSGDGKAWGTTITDNGDTANAGLGVVWWNPELQSIVPILAFPGTDSRHHINWTDLGKTRTDPNNWTNSDVEVTSCCTYLNDLFITWQAADSSKQIYYDQWTLQGTITSVRWVHQANAGIGVTNQNNCVYFAWGDLNGFVNVEQVKCV